MPDLKWVLIVSLSVVLSVVLFSAYYMVEKTQKQGLQEYLACGCGCCEDSQPEMKCLNYSAGERIAIFISEDRFASQGSVCKTASCIKGIRYVYCD